MGLSPKTNQSPLNLDRITPMKISYGKLGNITLYSDDGQEVVRVYPPIIDKMSITFDIPKNLQDEVRKKFYKKNDQIYSKELFQSVIGQWLPYAPSNLESKTTIHLQIDPKTTAFGRIEHMNFARITCNPSKVADFSEVRNKIDSIMPSGFGWDHIIKSGTVTRFDIAIDITKVNVDDFVLANSRTQVSKVYSKQGKTYELGKYSSGKEIIVYDKRAKIEALNSKIVYTPKKEPVPDFPVTRIEIQLNNNNKMLRNSTVTNILDYPNPFPTMTVAPTNHNHYDDDLEDWIWLAFLKMARFEGVTAAKYSFPQHWPKILARMKLSEPTWWRPDISWRGYPSLVHRLLESAGITE